ncbi:hypothetical protein ACI6PS_07210 [Flavobacterium sp. PLA-1-15]|uniref:hypothetical protein n=1 Tax=Flavobacterium sp. PLA-1-15 TaxID=3380533 RepID=UPI003B80124A
MSKTYLVTGNFDSANINLKIHLPVLSNKTYKFSTGINISKNVGGELNEVNAVFVFMQTEGKNDSLPEDANQTFGHNFEIQSLIQPGLGEIPFDKSRDTYILLYHNDEFKMKAVKEAYDRLLELIDKLNEGDCPRRGELEKSSDKNPRRLGVSIIRK